MFYLALIKDEVCQVLDGCARAEMDGLGIMRLVRDLIVGV